MGMALINNLLPESEHESYHTFNSADGDGLPNNSRYLIMEYYCDNPSCDCNDLIAAIFQIDCDGKLLAKKELAVIRYSWSSGKKCYPELDETSPKTQIALSLLNAYKQFVHDEDYLLRVKNHYARVKELTSKKALGEKQSRQDKQKIGRNDACPCGSNKKYKKCCINK